MKRVQVILAAILTLACGQSDVNRPQVDGAHPNAGIAGTADTSDAMILNGDDWVFSVKEPQGWVGTTDGADAVPANVIFYPDREPDMKAKPLIYIQLTGKSTEDMNEVLRADMEGFRRRFADAQLQDIEAPRIRYPLAAKVFIRPDGRREYVAFLNPGENLRYKLAVVLRVAGRDASAEERAAYLGVLTSILWMEGVTPAVP